MKICISISTYDAFEDLHIAADIIRSNWPKNHELYLVAGLCKPKSIGSLNRKLFDNSLEIETPQTLSMATFGEDSSLIERYGRNLNSIFKTGKNAIQHDCDYIIYLNSGSWPLDPSEIIRLAGKLGEKTFGVQIGNRMKYFFPEDHFLMINLAKAQFYKIYEFNYASRPFNPITLVANGFHGMLSCWLNQVPYGEVYVYSNHEHSIDAFGNKPFTLIPLIFNPNYKFLHSNSQFTFVKYLRLKYLDKYVRVKSNTVKKYMSSSTNIPNNYRYSEHPHPHLKERLSLKKIKSLTKNIIKFILSLNGYTSEYNYWDCLGVNTRLSSYDTRLVK